jgi:hypothetical protein
VDGGILVLGGPAGIGKTALLRHCAPRRSYWMSGTSAHPRRAELDRDSPCTSRTTRAPAALVRARDRRRGAARSSPAITLEASIPVGHIALTAMLSEVLIERDLYDQVGDPARSSRESKEGQSLFRFRVRA